MSTLTYTDAGFATTGKDKARATRRPLWRRVYEAMIRSQQVRAEREIAVYLKNRGDLLTDDMEREIMLRLSGRRGSAL